MDGGAPLLVVPGKTFKAFCEAGDTDPQWKHLLLVEWLEDPGEVECCEEGEVELEALGMRDTVREIGLLELVGGAEADDWKVNVKNRWPSTFQIDITIFALT